MKRILLISGLFLFCFMACDKSSRIIVAPIEHEEAPEDSALIRHIDSLSNALECQLRDARAKLAAMPRQPYMKPSIEAPTCADAVHE
jgi:hypothetical protein